MTKTRCLLVADELLTTAELAAAACGDARMELVVAPTLCAARRLLRDQPFDAVIAQADMPDGDGLDLLREPARLPGVDYFLLGGRLTKENAIDALRLGARDVFETPVNAGDAIQRVCGVTNGRARRQRNRKRYTRLRRLSSRIIKDRREVRRRVDIVCRDLVGAYRSLAEKFTAMEKRGSDAAPNDVY